MSPLDMHKQVAALEKVLQITRAMVASADLDELLGVIVERSMELLEAERATIFLYESERDELVSRVATGGAEIRIPASAGIAGACAASRCVLNIADAYADARFNRDVDRRTGFRTRNILALPLIDHAGQLVGVVQVLNKLPAGLGFSDADIQLAQTLAAQAGVVLQRQRLLEHYVQKQRMEQALAIARQIQQDLLPRENPRADGFDIAGWNCPADETGGDTYDFFHLGEGQWTITLADATGHGVGPALMIAEARAMLRALSVRPACADADQCAAVARGGRYERPDIGHVLARVNDLLASDLDGSRFVTCFFGLLSARPGTVRYASAGQGPIVFLDAATQTCEVSPATAMPLGVLEGCQFAEQVERAFRPGDVMAVVTDGFLEALNDSQEQFGTARLCELLVCCRHLPAEEIIQALRQAVVEFTGREAQADDLTAVVVKRV